MGRRGRPGRAGVTQVPRLPQHMQAAFVAVAKHVRPSCPPAVVPISWFTHAHSRCLLGPCSSPLLLTCTVHPCCTPAAPPLQAVFVAVKDKMDLSIAVALGSSIQIAICVIPAVVLVGWATGKDFTLDFDAFAVLMLTGEQCGRRPGAVLGCACVRACVRA